MQARRFSAAYEGPVLVIVWHGTPMLDDFAELDAEAARGIERNPDGIGLFIVISPDSSKPPSVEVRKRHADLVKKFGPNLLGMVRVLEGSGLGKSMKRVALSTIDMLSRSDVPTKTVESVEDGADWICEHSRQPRSTALAIISTVERLRPPGR